MTLYYSIVFALLVLEMAMFLVLIVREKDQHAMRSI